MTDSEACWLAVADSRALDDDTLLEVDIEQQPVLLVRQGGAVYALGGICTHQQARLCEGRIEHGRLLCPRHQAYFRLHDGTPDLGWRIAPLPVYPVRVRDGVIEVDAAAVRRRPVRTPVQVWDLTRSSG
jgi:3-phenylpropionate/trans-cinnamate dioxygenase ferredoxin subunit